MITTKGRYALRVMIDIAENGGENFIPLKDIALRQGISEKYLESILVVLAREGLLEGLRGKGGGYRLTKSADEYTVYDILLKSEGSLSPVACLRDGAPPCERSNICKTLPLWKGLASVAEQYLKSVTLASLI